MPNLNAFAPASRRRFTLVRYSFKLSLVSILSSHPRHATLGATHYSLPNRGMFQPIFSHQIRGNARRILTRVQQRATVMLHYVPRCPIDKPPMRFIGRILVALLIVGSSLQAVLALMA